MISIVTVNLNNKEGLEKTMNSVFDQTFFQNIEFITIDGGSTDGSKELIEQYKDKLAYWCSEKDGGIYPAMNKAIPHINGEYCLFLNSGDYLCDNDVIEKVVPLLDCGIVYGNEWKYKNHLKLTKYPDKLDELFFKTTSLPHQSSFIRTDLLKQHPYSEQWKIISDWEFFRERIMVDKVSYHHINIPISVYDEHGFSFQNHQLMLNEKRTYYKTHSITY